MRRWSTALTYIEPNKILVRGYPLDEMMGRLQFGEAIYLLLTGELPTPSIGRLMDAMLVSFIDHGATPPSTISARNVATTGSSIRGAVAAGVLGFGRYHGGDALACRQLLDEGLALARTGKPLAEVATIQVDRLVTAGEIPRRVSVIGTTRSTRGRRACCRSRTSWSSITSTRSSSA